VLDQMAGFIGFDRRQAAVLAEIGPLLRPCLPAVVARFCEAVTASPGASAVLSREGADRSRLERHIAEWLEGLFTGKYDAAYVERRARIGHTHLRIDLPAHFMLAAMNVVRVTLHGALWDTALPPDRQREAHEALDAICDIELALMLASYEEGYIEEMGAAERFITLGHLAASIGHDLRNPLAVIETSLHLLRQRIPDDARVARHLSRISDQVVISGRIISDLLELARDLPPERTPTAVRDLVEEAVLGVPSRPAVQVVIDVPEELPAVAVDAGQVRQVLVNLVMNAVQAVDGGGGGRVEVVARRSEGALVLLVVDDGPGLPAEMLEHIFQPLYTTRLDGIGLGLALCRRVVDKHGGIIDVSNQPSGGARFEVTLPGAFP